MNKITNRLGAFYEKAPAIASLLLCAAILITFGAVYFTLGLLPVSCRLLDATPNGIYTLHAETLSALDGLDTDVEVLIVSETGIRSTSTVEKLLDRYAERTKHLKLTYVYPEDVAESYGELTSGCAVVKSAYRETVIYSADHYELTDEAFEVSYSFYNYITQAGYSGTYSDFMYSGYGEYYGLFDLAVYQSTLTNAIVYAALEDVTTLYAVTEHGESVLDAYLYPELRESFTELVFGKLANGIPADADGVLINTPTSDISEEDAVILRDYLEKGGKLTLITDYSNIKSLTRLRALCEEYGLTTDGGFVCEDDKDHNFGGYVTALLPTLNADAFGGYLPALSEKPLSTWGTGITVSAVEGVVADVLIQSSPNAYTKQDIENQSSLEFNGETDTRGQLALGVMAKNTANGSTLLWLPSASFGDSESDVVSAGNNFPVFVAALSAQYASLKPIVIPAIEIATEPMDTSDGDFAVVMVFAIALPAAIIGFGVYKTSKRRK